MNEDVEIKKDNLVFKYRVSGILIQDGKLLAVKINDNKFYCLPGGHVELFEDSRKAVLREFKEETNIDVRIDRLLYQTENFFESNSRRCHEIGLYYLLTADELSIEDYEIIEHDKDGDVKLSFKWLDIDNLKEFKPEFIKDILNNSIENREIIHLIIKDDKIMNRD